MRTLLLTLFSLLVFISSQAQINAKPPTAEEILNSAYKKAADENKNVLLMFHASWCGWCHKMDNSINDKSCKELFDKNYVIKHLVVYESNGKKDLENPGALELLTKYKGNDLGIPYWMVFNKNGTLLADSKVRPDGAGSDADGENTGCPASEKEVTHFIKVLKQTSALNSDELEMIRKRFRENEQR
jgi:thiol-disulfide isomerase/thioredoxin